MNDRDLKMALLLQEQFEMEARTESPTNNLVYNDKKKKKKASTNQDSTKSLVDPSWELVDPTPNIHVLFMAFNDRFFWSKLGSVSVSWSKRMTTCAGVCSYAGRGSECKITISEPLLKLRPRKDLVETLLHEMIHALLFLTNNNKDRDGHGPEFHKHMYRINTEAGTNITVYHDFHDEVKLYQQHWWRCDGPCIKWKPHFGFVRRAVNRVPGPNDYWFEQHQRKCGGKFIKIKEPEKPKKSNKKVKEKEGKENKSKTFGDIRNFVSVTSPKIGNNVKTISTANNGGVLGTKNKNETVVLNAKSVKIGKPEKSATSKNKGNIFTINDVKQENNNNKSGMSNENIIKIDSSNQKGNIFTIKDIESFNNNTLKKPKSPTKIKNSTSPNLDYSVVRNKWLDKYENQKKTEENTKRKNNTSISNSPKKLKTETGIIEISENPKNVNCPVCYKLMNTTELNDHLDQCLQNDNVNLDSSNSSNSLKDNIIKVSCPSCNKTIEESLLNEHLDECLNKKDEPLYKPIKTEPQPSSSKQITSELTHCEICDKFINSSDFDIHMEDCLHKLYDDIEKKYNLSSTRSDNTNCLVCNKSILRTDLDEHLDSCMGNAFKEDMNEEIEDDREEEEKDINAEKSYNCPICMKLIAETIMNKHIDICLTEKNFD